MPCPSWLKWTQTQPWGAAFKAGLPVLGQFGALASVGRNSPAKGKVLAKTGTSAHPDPATGRVLIRPSGTEPLLRVMVEARDEHQARKVAERLAGAVRAG